MEKSGPVNAGLLFLRAAAGMILIVTQGGDRIKILLGSDPLEFANHPGIGAEAGFILVTLTELVCASMVILGIFCRLNCIPLIIYLGWTILGNGPAGVPGPGERALLFLVIYITLFITGPGRYNLRRLLLPREADTPPFFHFITR
jgi:putative oxidoreductase